MDDRPVGWIRLVVQGSRLTSNAIPPFVQLNGYDVSTRYGENVHPVPPGRWHVDAYCRWLRLYGQAAYDVDVAEGKTVDLYYAPPWHQFARGRMGPSKQRRIGTATFLLMLTVSMLVVWAAIALALD